MTIHSIAQRRILPCVGALLSCVAFLGSIIPVSAEEKAAAIDKSQIVGVWVAHPFNGPGTAPRIEFKKEGKLRALMQDDTEKEGVWKWTNESTVELSYTGSDRKISTQVSNLTKNSMTMVSSRGRSTTYVRLESWSAKLP